MVFSLDQGKLIQLEREFKDFKNNDNLFRYIELSLRLNTQGKMKEHIKMLNVDPKKACLL